MWQFNFFKHGRIILAPPLAWKDHPRMILLEETKRKDDPTFINLPGILTV